MSWYKEGSITLEQKNKKVIGSGTKWTNPLIGICAGQMLILKKQNTIEIHEIASVQTDTELTLAKPYNGETKSGLSYEIPTAPKVSIETLALRISEMFNYYQQQMEGWQTVLTGDGEVTLTAPDGRVVTIKSQYSIQKELLKLVEQGKNFAESANKSAGTIKNVSETVEGYANHAKVYAENANKSALASELSSKSSSDSAKIAKASENNANSAAKNAKTSENNAKKWASTIDTSTLVKKTGDTMSGQLILSKNGLKINYDNKNIMALITADDNYSHVFYDAEKKQWLSKLVYNSTINSWSFQYINDVVINGKSVLKTGDAIQTFGDLSTTINLNELTGSNEGIYYQGRNTSAVTERGYPINQAGTLQVFKNGADGAGCCQIYTTYRNARQFIRNYRGGTKTWEEWSEVITTANSTVDSNGFLKKASPILRLFANNNIEEVGGFKKSGCALVNDFAYGVTATRIDVGHYEIHGSLGFAKRGWYITLPEDANGNKKFFAEYSVDENNIITVKTYTKKFDFESCQIVAGKPIDITDGRWVDVRLEMPVIEVIENEEPIPSTLNPVIVSEVPDDI